MIIHDLIWLNQVAQGIESLEAGVEWFGDLEAGRQREVMQRLAEAVNQALPLAHELPDAARTAGIEPTHTPYVMLSRGPIRLQLTRMADLPLIDRMRAFRLLVALLGISDARRRSTRCPDGCTHWWHRDLSDEAILAEIRSDPSVW